MSDDIVTRLRGLVSIPQIGRPDMLVQGIEICEEAAAEIELLRGEVDSKDALAYRHLRSLYDERGDEISKLKEEIIELENACRSYQKSRDRAMRALVEAVRGE